MIAADGNVSSWSDYWFDCWAAHFGPSQVVWMARTTMPNVADLDGAACGDGGRMATESASLAPKVGSEAERRAIEADDPIWEATIEAGERWHAAILVSGSPCPASRRSMPLGSVSSAVVQKARFPIRAIDGIDRDRRSLRPAPERAT